MAMAPPNTPVEPQPNTPLTTDFSIAENIRPLTATPKASEQKHLNIPQHHGHRESWTEEQVREWREHIINGPMSPEAERSNPFEVPSSPSVAPASMRPSPAPTRRGSNAVSFTGESFAVESFAAESFAELSLVTSNTGGSVILSEPTIAAIREIDRKLENFLLNNEQAPKKVSIYELPEEIPEALKHQSFIFHCAFGWDGVPEDLEDTPLTKAAFLEKLQQEKEGLIFVQNSLQSYMVEVNSRRAHRFKTDFLHTQNSAVTITLEQLDQIEGKVQKVVEEVKAINEHDKDVGQSLLIAYKHAAPWIRRINRLVNSNHIFYKVNYTMGVKARKQKKQRKRYAEVREETVSFQIGTPRSTLT